MNIVHNIRKLYLIRFSRWFLLAMPIVVPFYHSNQMSTQDIMTLQALFSISIVLLEVPTGYFGDVLGRKKSLIIGTAFTFAGYLTYCFAGQFLHFLGAATLLGIGVSFVSGSDSALLYDSLLQLKDEKNYAKYQGRTNAIGNFSEAGAGILGGIIASYYSLRHPFYVQTAISFLGIIAALTLVEPTRSQHFSNHKTWDNILRTIRFAFLENQQLRWFLLYAGSIAATSLTMAWFAQPYFEFAELPLLYFGVLWTALNLTVGIFAWSAHRIQRTFSSSTLFIGVFLLGTMGHLGAAFVGWSQLIAPLFGIAFIFLVNISRGIAQPLFQTYLNQQISSDMRATVLSLYSFLTRLLFASIAPFLGWIADVYSLPQALFLSGSIFLVCSGISLWWFRKG